MRRRSKGRSKLEEEEDDLGGGGGVSKEENWRWRRPES